MNGMEKVRMNNIFFGEVSTGCVVMGELIFILFFCASVGESGKFGHCEAL
jgi:hypothetical protein